MKEQSITTEVEALLDYFQNRDLSPREACAVMGMTLEALLANRDLQADFLGVLKQRLLAREAEETLQ
jgi:hypothetical protein